MSKRRDKGEGTVFQRPDGRWEGCVDLGWADGKRQRRSIYGRTKKEALAKLSQMQRQAAEGTLVVSERTTVEQFCASWLEAIRPSLRPGTWRRYEQYVRVHTVPTLGRVPLTKLTPQHLQQLYAARLAAGASAQSVVHLHRMLHRALSQAVKWGLISRNIAALVDPPRVERVEFEPLTAEEAGRLLDAAKGDRLEALYVLALTTGLRRGELLGLRWQDIDLDARVLHVRRSLQIDEDGKWRSGDPKTKRSRRPVLLVDMAVEALKQHRQHQDHERKVAGELWKDSTLVFSNTVGGPIWGEDLLKRSFYPLLQRAGLRRVRFHDLRHSTATLLLTCGVHPKIVSEILGHSRISITMDLYTHVSEDMQREAVDRLQELIGRQIGRQTLDKAPDDDGHEPS
jgi:integrase